MAELGDSIKGLFLALFTAVLVVSSAALADENRFPTTCSVVLEENAGRLDGSYSASFSTTGSASSYSVWSCKNPNTTELQDYGSFQENLDIPFLTRKDDIASFYKVSAFIQPPFSCTVGVQGFKSLCSVTCNVWEKGATPICVATSVSHN